MKRDHRREISRKRIQQNRRTILRRNPTGTRYIMTPTTSLNPTADAALLASSIRMSTDEFQGLSMSQITAAYGVCMMKKLTYLRPIMKIIKESLSGSWNQICAYGRTTRTSPNLCLCRLTMSVSSVMPPPQVFRRDPQDSRESLHKSEKEPHPKVDLYGKGCLWRVSKPDDGPFNEVFHAPDESCKYCIMR